MLHLLYQPALSPKCTWFVGSLDLNSLKDIVLLTCQPTKVARSTIVQTINLFINVKA